MNTIEIITDSAGFVLDCSPAALELLGYSRRGARGRQLANMFVGERPRLAELLRAAQGEIIERDASFRPNDRKAVRVRFRVTAAAPQIDGGVSLLWTFTVRWSIGMRVPRGVDRRLLITVWRSESLRCVFVPGGANKRRLLVCAPDDEVIYEEAPSAAATAFARAEELQKLAHAGSLHASESSQTSS